MFWHMYMYVHAPGMYMYVHAPGMYMYVHAPGMYMYVCCVQEDGLHTDEKKILTLDKPMASLSTCHLGLCLRWQSC